MDRIPETRRCERGEKGPAWPGVLLRVDEDGGERPGSAQPRQVSPLEIIEGNPGEIRAEVEILHGPEGGVPDVVAAGHHHALQ